MSANNTDRKKQVEEYIRQRMKDIQQEVKDIFGENVMFANQFAAEPDATPVSLDLGQMPKAAAETLAKALEAGMPTDVAQMIAKLSSMDGVKVVSKGELPDAVRELIDKEKVRVGGLNDIDPKQLIREMLNDGDMEELRTDIRDGLKRWGGLKEAIVGGSKIAHEGAHLLGRSVCALAFMACMIEQADPGMTSRGPQLEHDNTVAWYHCWQMLLEKILTACTEVCSVIGYIDKHGVKAIPGKVGEMPPELQPQTTGDAVDAPDAPSDKGGDKSFEAFMQRLTGQKGGNA